MFKLNEYNRIICPSCGNWDQVKEQYVREVGYTVWECNECWEVFDYNAQKITEQFWKEYYKD